MAVSLILYFFGFTVVLFLLFIIDVLTSSQYLFRDRIGG